MLILAGDIGGTTTRLAFFRANDSGLETVAQASYPSREHGSLAAIVTAFLASEGRVPDRACFGIAGPVRDNRVLTPNLPWLIDGSELAGLLGLGHVCLLNDLQSNAYGISLLHDEDFAVLNSGVPDPSGAIAVISAGTGLGETIAPWDGSSHRPLAGEGGHTDFAPRNELETRLLLYLRAEFGRVSYERVLSGPGLINLYRFLRDQRQIAEDPAIVAEMSQGNPAAVISRAGTDGSCTLCRQALELFVSLYGAEAGNLALRALATGGVYLGGGIAPKILASLMKPAFMLAFTAKGRLSPLLETIPVRVILNDRAALLGAGRYAMLADC